LDVLDWTLLNLNKLDLGAPNFTKDEEINWANWGPQRAAGFASLMGQP